MGFVFNLLKLYATHPFWLAFASASLLLLAEVEDQAEVADCPEVVESGLVDCLEADCLEVVEGRQAKACQAVESKERAQEERQDICASRPREAAAVEAGLAKECQLASRPRQAAAVEAGLEAKECQLASHKDLVILRRLLHHSGTSRSSSNDRMHLRTMGNAAIHIAHIVLASIVDEISLRSSSSNDSAH